MVEMDLLPDVKLDVALAHLVSVGKLLQQLQYSKQRPVMTRVPSGKWMKLERRKYEQRFIVV